MSKEQRSNKEDKKKPGMTPKEKKAAKKAKKDAKKQPNTVKQYIWAQSNNYSQSLCLDLFKDEVRGPIRQVFTLKQITQPQITPR